ncbi:tRNA (adenosine(37)-N6)-threonylcarbamoyltransferase complex dimerization subunit type 1 TsaB [Desulfobacterales bacterium HSG16]|nr:tRNA (adenosine(37)-N6)-threonylcarbamoyltransferase complex dimerization subunit type 1 TsaB [Desulfobacterales bacterium HSG16]
MKILAVDTAATSCSVAVVADNVTSEQLLVSTRTHATHLMDMIDRVLKTSKIAFADLDGIAVTRGPGSFTGLRIGISTVKGLCAASGKPLVGISNLDALAFQIGISPYPVCVMLDARKKEVYCRTYKVDGKKIETMSAETVSRADEVVKSMDEPCLFVGSGAVLYKDIVSDLMGQSFFLPEPMNILRAGTIAHMSMDRFRAGETDDPALFAPRYIRKPDAALPGQI